MQRNGEKMKENKPCAIAYYGNIVDLLQYAVDNNIHIDLLSDLIIIYLFIFSLQKYNIFIRIFSLYK